MPDGNLYQIMKQCALSKVHGVVNNCLSPQRIKSITEQVLKGMHHMHAQGFSHRDIKPENLLLKGDVCKIADFGLARQSRPSLNAPALTEYISTRWYRAPEILLRDPNYGTPIDIFALGCVMAEMITLKPLFPGTNEIDQIQHIVRTLGAPSLFHWPEGMALVQKLRVASLFGHESFHNDDPMIIQQRNRMNLEQAIPGSSPGAIAVIQKMLALDPRHRPPAGEMLKDPYFSMSISVEAVNSPNMNRMMSLNKQELCSQRFSPRTSATEMWASSQMGAV